MYVWILTGYESVGKKKKRTLTIAYITEVKVQIVGARPLVGILNIGSGKIHAVERDLFLSGHFN